MNAVRTFENSRGGALDHSAKEKVALPRPAICRNLKIRGQADQVLGGLNIP